MLVTFRVALHYVRRDNCHLFMSCDAARDLSRFVEVLFCKELTVLK